MLPDLKKVVDYFCADPLRILYFFGGSSGLWFWIEQWRGRVRLMVKPIKGGSYISNDLNNKYYLRCEIENIGNQTTSLKSQVIFTGYTPKRVHKLYKGTIAEQERDLPPHKPKAFTVEFDGDEVFGFLLLRSYRFTLTRGCSKTLRLWSSSLVELSLCRLLYERIRFKVFGVYNEPKAF